MTAPHPYNAGYCLLCHNPDGKCTGVQASDIDQTRVLPLEVLASIEADLHITFEPGSSIADVIDAACAIGYGGHFDETSEDEEAVYEAIAVDDRELAGIYAARYEYTNLLRDAMHQVGLPLRPRPLMCDRHGGPWGDDETCPRCTYQDGRVRPPLDDPGPLGPGTED